MANAYDDGDQKMVQFNLRDIGDRKRFERQLEHTQKMESLGLLAGGIAHDFNNLLAGIMVNASVVLSEMEKDSPSLPSLRELMRASERAANLTRQMLDYAGKGRFVTEHNDLNELIRDISVLVRSSLPKMVTFDLVLTSDPTYVDGDSGQIQQLIMNLVINAGEAIPEGRPGAVTVRTQVRELTAGQLLEYVEGQHLGSGKYVVSGGHRYRFGYGRGDPIADLRSVLHNQVHRAGAGTCRRTGHYPEAPRCDQAAFGAGPGNFISGAIAGQLLTARKTARRQPVTHCGRRGHRAVGRR